MTSLDAANDLLAGMAAGVTSKLVEYPLDTVKVRVQEEGSRFHGCVDCTVRTFKEEGAMAFFRGIAAPINGSILECAMLFYSYSATQRVYRTVTGNNDETLPLISLAICGSAAGFWTSMVICPFDLVKCKLQVPGSPYRNSLDCARSILRTKGVSGFFLGWTPTAIREMSGNFFWYGGYETVCRLLMKEGQSKQDLTTGQLAFAGGWGGVFYWSVCYPGDTVKTRVQVNERYRSMGFMRSLGEIYRQGGLRTLYAGFTLTLLRAFPSNACLFATYEVTLKKLEQIEKSLEFGTWQSSKVNSSM